MNNILILEANIDLEKLDNRLFFWAKTLDSNNCSLYSMWEEADEVDIYKMNKIFHFKYKNTFNIYLIGDEDEGRVIIETGDLFGQEFLDFIADITGDDNWR